MRIFRDRSQKLLSQDVPCTPYHQLDVIIKRLDELQPILPFLWCELHHARKPVEPYGGIMPVTCVQHSTYKCDELAKTLTT